MEKHTRTEYTSSKLISSKYMPSYWGSACNYLFNWSTWTFFFYIFLRRDIPTFVFISIHIFGLAPFTTMVAGKKCIRWPSWYSYWQSTSANVGTLPNGYARSTQLPHCHNYGQTPALDHLFRHPSAPSTTHVPKLMQSISTISLQQCDTQKLIHHDPFFPPSSSP